MAVLLDSGGRATVALGGDEPEEDRDFDLSRSRLHIGINHRQQVSQVVLLFGYRSAERSHAPHLLSIRPEASQVVNDLVSLL